MSKGRPALRTGRIAGLNLQFLNGVLHVGGRIDQAELSWEAKHLIILDRGNDVNRLILTDYHPKARPRRSGTRVQSFANEVLGLTRSTKSEELHCQMSSLSSTSCAAADSEDE